MKDWIKVLIASLTGTLVTIIITSIIAYPGNIEDKFNETDIKIIEAKEASKNYTDKAIEKHQTETEKQTVLLMKYLDNRFDNIEKLLDEKRK